MALVDRIKHGWNAFLNRDPTSSSITYRELGSSYSDRPDRMRFTRGNDRSIINAIFNRISSDVAAVKIEHVKLDDNDRYYETIESGLNNCLNLEANIDQTGRAFVQDIVASMLDEGCVGIVPVDTDDSPSSEIDETTSFMIQTMRTGKILEWYPQHVRVRVYNDRTGRKEDVILHKKLVGIIENPFYSIMNEPNSTLRRLVRKLNLLDFIDEQSGSGKLDLIIQLPYTIRTESRREEARKRKNEIEEQLVNSKYGIAYTDGTEHITQLNRPAENNLLKQIEYLTEMLYSQLGITNDILNGTASEEAMLNYNNRVIEPLLSAITNELKRKFLTKTARSQKHTIMFFRDPFKLVPVNQVAEIADKFTRNEIMTSNEIRQEIGMKPSSDPKADELRNSNLSAPAGQEEPTVIETEEDEQ